MATAPDDANRVQSQANQDAVRVSKSGSNITIRGNLSALNSFASTNPSQGSGKWIGLDLGTNLDSIVGATWNGSALTASDVEEAASVGLAAGHIIFWVKAESIVETPRTIVIGADGYDSVTVTVSFVDIG